MPKNNGSERKKQKREEALARVANSTNFSDSRYKCNHLHTSPYQFQRCMTRT